MEIFLDYARRLDLHDKDGASLVKWSTPEECFEAWHECSRGRPCDYTGLSYEKLRGGSGIQWPCNDDAPDGTERLYEDHVFATFPEVCEDFGHDLETGRDVLRGRVRGARRGRPGDPEGGRMDAAARVGPRGVPVLAHDRSHRLPLPHAHEHRPRARAPGRRAGSMGRAVPGDADKLGVVEGDLLRVSSPRGSVEVPARIRELREGVVFVPFHYGYWDDGEAGPDGRPRAANELTMTIWDPVSKQPQLKTAAVKLEQAG